VTDPIHPAESGLVKWCPRRPGRIDWNVDDQKFLFFSMFVALFTLGEAVDLGKLYGIRPISMPPLPPLGVTGAMTSKIPLPMMGWLYGQAIAIFIFSETTSFRFRISATALSSTH